MKFKTTLFTGRNLLLLFIFSFLFSGGTIFAQGLQISLSYGLYKTTPKFNHTTSIKNSSSFGNSTLYSIGLTKKLSNNFYLQTELGFISNISFFSIIYNYDEGFGEKHNILLTWLHNERVYIGIIPEFRKKYKSIGFFINGGILFSKDLKNKFATLQKTYSISSYPLGISLNAGLNVYFNSITLKISLNYMSFTKSKLINKYHPYISYSNIGTKFGILYSF